MTRSIYSFVLLAPLVLGRPQNQEPSVTLQPPQPTTTFRYGPPPPAQSAYPPSGGGGTEAPLLPEYQKNWYQDVDEQKDGDQAAGKHSCAGPKAADYPSIDKWKSFESMWKINEAQISEKNKGDMEITGFIKEGIKTISRKAMLDARIILTMITEESTGQADVGCPAGPCGLMQITGGSDFKPADAKASIEQMIHDGVFGVGATPGYLTIFNGNVAGYPYALFPGWKGNPYVSAKMYNAGNLKNEDLTSEENGMQESIWYVNDFASKLLGWDGLPTGCADSQKCEIGGKKPFAAKECGYQGAAA